MISRAFRGLVVTLGLLGQSVIPAFGIIMDGFNDANIERGMRRMKIGLEELTNVIKVGLTQAWKDFWSEVEPITSRISAVFMGIVGIVKELATGIARIVDSVVSLIFGGSAFGGTFENIIGDIFSANNIESFFKGVQTLIKELANLIVSLVNALKQLFALGDLPSHIARIRDAITGGPLGRGVQFSEMPIFGLEGAPTEMDMLAEKSRKLREDLNLQSEAWDHIADVIERARKIYEKFFKVRDKDVPKEILDALGQVQNTVAASLVGSFESTRGQKLKLLDNSQERIIKELKLIEENTREGDEF